MAHHSATATYKGFRIFNTFLGARRAARKAQGPVIGYILPHPQGDAFPTPHRITASTTLVDVAEPEQFDPYAIKAN